MPTNPLTAADLYAIEDRHTTTLDDGDRVIDEDTAHLLAAVREVRALVEALLDQPFEVDSDSDDQSDTCTWCHQVVRRWRRDWRGNVDETEYPHAPDCAWEAAREALAAWKGGGDAPPQGRT